MKTIKVEDMRCEMCVKRISEALREEGISFEVSLADKTVSVDENSILEAAERLEELGFSPEL